MNILYDERVDGVLPDVDKAVLLRTLRTRLPNLEVLHQREELKPYECDGLSAYRTTPLLVVLPRQLDEVQGVLRICHELRVPVVARGAGTGLSAGALPLEKGVLLEVTSRLVVNRTAFKTDPRVGELVEAFRRQTAKAA